MNKLTAMKTEAIAQAIKELKEVPSGELYAFICGGIGLEEYLEILSNLKVMGAITEKHYLLTWIGTPDMFPAPLKSYSGMIEVSPEEYEQIKSGEKDLFDDKSLYGEFYEDK